jgi:hypothetical protein
MARRLSVLVAEDNAANLNMYLQRYAKFFAQCGYNASFDPCNCNSELIKEKVASGTHDVLITDITFGDSQELGGLYLARDIKLKYPQVFVIGNSQSEIGMTRMVGPSFDLFVPKDALAANEIITNSWFRTEFEKKFRCNTELLVDDDGLKEFPAKARPEVKRVLQEALFTSHGFDEAFDLASVSLKLLTRGYSDSKVFKLKTVSRDRRFRHIQSVIKISDVNKAQLELQNFNRYVRWTLPFEWRVDVLGSAFGARYGAICYSFVDGSDTEEAIFDLEHFLLLGAFHKIKYVMAKIMNVDARKWYQGGIYPSEESITVFYNERYYTSYESDFRATQRIFEKDVVGVLGFLKSDGAIVSTLLNERITLPTAGVLSRRDLPCQTCIGHGDLHSRNILVSARDEGKVVFIDFQQTGRCHVFEDFIIFETSIRMLFEGKEAELADRYRHEQEMNNDERVTDGGKYELIGELRDRAFSHFPHEPKRNYIFGLLLFSMRLLREKKIVGRSRENLIVCIISCCKYFEENE